MNLAQQRRVIAVSAMMVFALGFLSHANKGELPTARFLIGTGGVFTIVSIFADFGMPIGAAMAIVILLTAVLTEGDGVIKLLSERSGDKPTKEAKAPSGGDVNIVQNLNLPGSNNPRFNPRVKGPPSPRQVFEVPSLLGGSPQHPIFP